MSTVLTDAIVKKLPLPETASKIHYDGSVAGFGCRVTAAGARAYVLRYRVRGTGRERSYTIGGARDWTVGAARLRARELRREIDQGGDPLGDLEDERSAPTVAELIDRFDAEHVEPRTRPATAHAYRALLKKYIRPHFGKHKKVADVEFADIDALHRKISEDAPYAANRTVAVLSKMFSLAILWNMRDKNPCRGIQRNIEAKRKRYLSGDELARLTAALTSHPDQQVANVIRICLLTGCRIGEALSMRWADISQTEVLEDGNVIRKTVWTKPASTTKQKADHVVPLSAPVAQLLDGIREQQSGKRRPLGAFVFPSVGSAAGHVVDIKKPWKTICKEAGIEGLRVHDLRHSFASQLASGGASLPQIGALLGHTNVATTARYSHLFDDPQRVLVERVGAIVAAAGKPAETPVPFPKGGRRGR